MLIFFSFYTFLCFSLSLFFSVFLCLSLLSLFLSFFSLSLFLSSSLSLFLSSSLPLFLSFSLSLVLSFSRSLVLSFSSFLVLSFSRSLVLSFSRSLSLSPSLSLSLFLSFFPSLSIWWVPLFQQLHFWWENPYFLINQGKSSSGVAQPSAPRSRIPNISQSKRGWKGAPGAKIFQTLWEGHYSHPGKLSKWKTQRCSEITCDSCRSCSLDTSPFYFFWYVTSFPNELVLSLVRWNPKKRKSDVIPVIFCVAEGSGDFKILKPIKWFRTYVSCVCMHACRCIQLLIWTIHRSEGLRINKSLTVTVSRALVCFNEWNRSAGKMTVPCSSGASWPDTAMLKAFRSSWEHDILTLGWPSQGPQVVKKPGLYSKNFRFPRLLHLSSFIIACVHYDDYCSSHLCGLMVGGPTAFVGSSTIWIA